MSVGPIARGALNVAPTSVNAPGRGATAAAPAQTGGSFAANYARDSFEPAKGLTGPRINMDGFGMQAAEALAEIVGLKEELRKQVRISQGKSAVGPSGAPLGDGL